jgi:antitoxin component YwqK of YwqJK toxin-antitoxin module
MIINLSIAFSQDNDCIKYNSKERRAYNKEDTTRLFTGECNDNYNNNQLETSSYFKDGLLIYQNNYDKKGRLVDSMMIIDNKEETYELFAYDNKGILTQYFQLKDNVNHGITKSFYRNGIVQSEICYENGKRNGKEIFYYKNGKKRIARNYENDNYINPTYEWDENGVKYEVIYRVNKRKIGDQEIESFYEESRKQLD